MTPIIVIKHWERFQHYKDRDPPWIKLYRDVLTSESWVLGSDASRLIQLAITLLAARYQNATPHNFALVKKVCSLDCSKTDFDKAVTHLAQMNFLEIQGLPSDEKVVAQVASNPLATCSSDARLQEAEAEAETETEAETEQRQRPLAKTLAVAGLNREQWERFADYRKKRKPAIRPESREAAMRQLAAFGELQAAVVTHTIANGYQGLVAPRSNGHGAHPAGQSGVDADGIPTWVTTEEREEILKERQGARHAN